MKINKEILLSIDEASEILGLFFKGIDGRKGDASNYRNELIKNKMYNFTLYESFSIKCNDDDCILLEDLIKSILRCKYLIGFHAGEKSNEKKTKDVIEGAFYSLGINLIQQ